MTTRAVKLHIPKAIVALGLLLAWCTDVFALDASLDISQYAHTAWKIRDGFPKGFIAATAQPSDGYLWLGTEFGVLRFDGVRAAPWQPPAGQHLPGGNIRSLLAARDGTVWIGTNEGLASFKDGKLLQYVELAGKDVYSLLEDREGTIWVGADPSSLTGRLCAIRGSRVRCEGKDGRFGEGPVSLYEDSRGSLWVGVPTGVWRWKPGPPQLYLTPGPDPSVKAIVEGDHGEPLFATQHGIRHLVDGRLDSYPLAATRGEINLQRLLYDRNGALWIGTGDGLFHVHQGRMDQFARADGLSGDRVIGLFEDREGSIWVATVDGFDRFREFAVPTISAKEGLSSIPMSVLAAADGSIWLGTLNGLSVLRDGSITTYRKGSASIESGAAKREQPGASWTVREITDRGLPDDVVQSLEQDGRGRIWVTTLRGMAYFENDRLMPVKEVPAGYVYSIVDDGAGNVWISHLTEGLLHLRDGRVIENFPWVSIFGLGHNAISLLPDPVPGGLWLGFSRGGMAYFKEGQVRSSYGAGDGLGQGHVFNLQLDGRGTLWAATEGGLSRYKDGRFTTLSSRNGLPCDSVHWMMEDDSHSVWLETSCGLVRIARPELDAWAADPKRRIRTTVFDNSDGVRSHGNSIPCAPSVARSSDGKIWFLAFDGVSVIDPRHLPFNKLPPPVDIEQITADRKTYDASSNLHLPPLIRDLEIDYTALSLVAPEKNQFRYKLEGRDRDWQSVGDRRQAYYNDVPPGNYRFRVIASNNSGVWNEQGAALDFSIAPAYWQTTWFRAACVAASLFMLWALYQLRLREIAREFNSRLEERVGERTRIARDLHDTLLQNFQGLLLRFQTVLALCETRPAEAKEVLRSSIDQTAQAITEGREAVQGLRASTVESNDLAQAITTLGEQLAADASSATSVGLHVKVEGTSRNLHPIVRDEIYRVASEALRNAFRHAEAQTIEVELRYDQRQFRLRVRDDGKGIDATILTTDGRAGHFGLPGMRERAKLMGGKLTVWTAAESGTEIELIIPATRAYAASPRRSWFAEWFSGKGVRSKT